MTYGISTVCLMIASFLLGILYGKAASANNQPKSIWVKIEEESYVFYAYNNKTSKYLARSDSKEELVDQLKVMFPDFVIYIVED
jgi:hypothetical protein